MLDGGGRRLCPHKLIVLFCCFLLLPRDAASQLQARRPNSPLSSASDLDLIVSYVTVTASKGAALRRASTDFHILEDDTEQKIDYFSVQDQPASVGALWGAGTGFDEPPPDQTLANVREPS